MHPSTRTLSGGEALVATVAAAGVDTALGIPGTHNLGIYAHLGAYALAHTTVRHEQAAGFGADGYARVSGRPALCLTTTGPGITNAATALAQAYSDSVPLLAVSPGVPSDHPATGDGFLHEAKDQGGAIAALIADSLRVGSVAEIPRAVALALHVATDGRPRPVHVEIPVDLVDARGLVTVPPPSRPVPRQPHADAVDAAARLLAAARRPGIVVGGGARGAAGEVEALARRLGAIIATTANGKGIPGDHHPQSLGSTLHLRGTREALEACDALVAVGSELAGSDLWDGPLAVNGPVVRVDVDPAQAHLNQIATVALIGDAKQALSGLLTALGAADHAADGCERAAAVLPAVRRHAEQMGGRWHPVLAALREALPHEAVLACDSAMVCYYGAVPSLPIGPEGRLLYPSGFGTLGYGLPAAIGAKLADPDRPVAALHGDGGIMLTVAEIASAAAAGLPIPVIVVDNGGYGEIRAEMVTRGMAPLAVDLPSPDFPALGRALGGRGVAVEDPADLRAAVGRALRDDRPTIIAVPEPR